MKRKYVHHRKTDIYSKTERIVEVLVGSPLHYTSFISYLLV